MTPTKAAVADKVRFTSQSLAYRDKFRDAVMENLRNLAMERAARDGRDIVTEADFQECINRAMELTIREMFSQQPR